MVNQSTFSSASFPFFFHLEEYATRVPYRAQLSPADVVESSPPTGPTRVKQQRQQSPYPSEPTSFYPSTSPSSRHLPSTSNSNPSSPHSPITNSRPSVIMSKNLHSNPTVPIVTIEQTTTPVATPHYQPYVQYECPTFAQQQYPVGGPTADSWYYHHHHHPHHPHHHHHPNSLGGVPFPPYPPSS